MADYPSPGTRDDVEQIVGLFLMTFGQGVAPLHVHRSTVQAIRDQLVPTISNAVQSPDWNDQWKRDAASVLGWMAGIGAMAKQIAMEPKARRSIVDPSDFQTAWKVVLAEHDPSRGGGVTPLGKWCM
ncbi:MAG: hypothetical protein AB7U83_05220 [Vicinamibacterales bacterium]